jgi:hypothetical protein
MAKVICICRRDGGGDSEAETRARFEHLNRRLTPDNITPNPPAIFQENGVTTAVLNPTETPARHGTSVCLGVLVHPAEDWWRPRSAVPDGTYALFRSDGAAIELLNDVVGTRTIWYAQTDSFFVASTSQRAIVALLGSFEPNPNVIPWMLSVGQLGPDNSYDRRIRVVRPNSRVLVDRAAWRLTVTEMGNDIVPVERPRKEHADGLRRSIEHVFGGLDLDPAKWVLPLSGGVDSRAILYWLKRRDGLRTVTWGVRAALEDRGTDACVAVQVARHFNLDHRFFATDVSTEPVDTLFTRFLVAGEGRVDAVAGYTDGFKIWKDLFEEKAAGVIRGDECFGMRMPVYTAFGVRRYVNCLLLSDYDNLPASMLAQLPEHKLPGHLEQRDGEPILRWRDRLYYNYRTPFVMAALTDLKCAYVEVVNPFQSRSIVDYMRTVPDSLRLGRKPFMDVVNPLSPPIPYAERAAIDTSLDVFKSKPVVDMIIGELGSPRAAAIFPEKVLHFFRKNVQTLATEAPARPETHAKYMIPSAVRKKLGQVTRRPRGLLRDRFKKPVLDLNAMAFRAFVISRMRGTLEEDARAFSAGFDKGRHA